MADHVTSGISSRIGLFLTMFILTTWDGSFRFPDYCKYLHHIYKGNRVSPHYVFSNRPAMTSVTSLSLSKVLSFLRYFLKLPCLCEVIYFYIYFSLNVIFSVCTIKGRCSIWPRFILTAMGDSRTTICQHCISCNSRKAGRFCSSCNKYYL